MGVVGGAGDREDLAVAGEDVHLEHRLVRRAVAEARALDAEAGDGSAQGDGAQLRHAHGHQAVRKRRVDEVLVGGHAEHLGGARDRIDVQHAVEGGDVEAGRAHRVARTEQVRRPLRQPDRGPVGDGAVLLEQRRLQGAVPSRQSASCSTAVMGHTLVSRPGTTSVGDNVRVTQQPPSGIEYIDVGGVVPEPQAPAVRRPRRWLPVIAGVVTFLLVLVTVGRGRGGRLRAERRDALAGRAGRGVGGGDGRAAGRRAGDLRRVRGPHAAERRGPGGARRAG